MPAIRPVILSGGAGTRLWPLSTDDRPKQFAPLVVGPTLFGATLGRVAGLPGLVGPTLVTGARHLSRVAAELSGIDLPGPLVMVEPEGRNTGPAVAAAASTADEDDILVILPSDHLIADTAGFRRHLLDAVELAEKGAIVTFGVRPDRPETGYGYLECGPPEGPASRLVRFLEKPDSETATALAGDGRHLWNSGMFVASAGTVLAEMERVCPDVLDPVCKAVAGRGMENPLELGDEFLDAPRISFDHAVMERTGLGLVIQIDVGWSDIGSFLALMSIGSPDADGNVTRGPVILEAVRDSLVYADTRPVAVLGLDGVAVIDTDAGVLVIPLERSQEVRGLADRAGGV